MTEVSLNQSDKAAVDAVCRVRPVWDALSRAGVAVGIDRQTLLHAGPPFDAPSTITTPVLNSACAAAIFEGIAPDFEKARDAILSGDIELKPAQNFNVVTPLAGVVSASMWLHDVSDRSDPTQVAHAPINGGNGPAMRLGLFSNAVVDHLRWINGPFAQTLGDALEGGIDLVEVAAASLGQGDDCHGRTIAGTRELLARLSDGIPAGSEARAFIEDGPSIFLNLWMAACKCMLASANGRADCSLITAAGANGATTGIQVAGLPGQWFTAPAVPPNGDLGDFAVDRALGAIGDSAIVDVAGFGAMAMSYAPAQREGLGPYMPDDGFERPHTLLAGVHPGFGALDLRTGLCARTVVATQTTPVISLGIIDKAGTDGRLGGGIYQPPAAPFEEAVRALAKPN